MKPQAYCTLSTLPMPMPQERLGPDDGPYADAAALGALALAPRTDILAPPPDPGERAFHRWVLGHHAAFGVWRLLGDLLEDMLRRGPSGADMVQAARWYDRYSALLLYAGSCSPQMYATAIRPRMAAAHPAFSGVWARDYERVLQLIDQLDPPADRVLKAAMKRNRSVHMAIAGILVPNDKSLLKQAGRRAGHGATDAERDIFDNFFLVRRGPVRTGVFGVHLLYRLAAIRCDLAADPAVAAAHPEVSAMLPADLPTMMRDIAIALTDLITRNPMELDKRIRLTPRISDYVVSQAEPPTPEQQWLLDATTELGGVAEMQIPHEQAVFLTLLAQSIGAANVVEVGTFTGYSTLALARGLAPGGKVRTYDISNEWTPIAIKAWSQAGVLDRIEQHIGPAAETLSALPGEPTIDLAFLDADKVGYRGYWETLVPRMRPGGLILADNVLYAGEAADDEPTGNGLAIKEFNAHVRADDRVESVLLTISDGLTIARKVA